MNTTSETPLLPASLLYVPAHREDLFHKALNTSAHAIIVDLEDGVPKAHKEEARNNIASLLAGSQNGLDPSAKRPALFIRVNSGQEASTDLSSIQTLIEHASLLSGIVFSKAEHETIAELTALKDTDLTTICLIESAQGLHALPDLAQHCDGFGVGRQDLAADLRIDGTRFDALLPYLAQIVYVSRIANIAPPIAPTYLNVREENSDKILQYAQEYFRHGFRSQTAIHPKFLDSIHTTFLPTQQEYEHAKTALTSFTDNETFVDESGNFVDAAVIRQYQEVIQRYEH